MNRNDFSKAAERLYSSSSTIAPTAAGLGLPTGPRAACLPAASRGPTSSPQALRGPPQHPCPPPTSSCPPLPDEVSKGLKPRGCLRFLLFYFYHQRLLSHQEAGPSSPEDHEIPPALQTQVLIPSLLSLDFALPPPPPHLPDLRVSSDSFLDSAG